VSAIEYLEDGVTARIDAPELTALGVERAWALLAAG
jgi:hypothetical protein